MSSDELKNTATNEVVSAEAELRAAQEALEAAKARLAELKDEHPPLEPGNPAGEAEKQAFEVVDASAEENVAEVEAVVAIGEAVAAEANAELGYSNSGAKEAVIDTSVEAHPEASAHAVQVGEEVAKTAEVPMEHLGDEVPEVSVEPETDSGESPTPVAASAQEPVADWVPYSTMPPAAAPAGGAVYGAPSNSSAPIPPAGAVPQAQQSNAPYPNAQQPDAPQAYAQQPFAQQQSAQQPFAPQPQAGYEAPNYGQTPHAGPGAVPPQQPYYGYQQNYYQPQYAPAVSTKDHVAAGLLAIFLGQLGIHKFYLGYNTSGFIMLAVTIIGSIFTFGLAAGVMWIIAVIEGIMYLTKSQSEFEQMYVVNKRDWF